MVFQGGLTKPWNYLNYKFSIYNAYYEFPNDDEDDRKPKLLIVNKTRIKATI